MDTDFKVLMTLMGLDIGGAETHVLELCKALAKKGVTVYVASNGGAYEKELEECGIIHFKVPFHNKRVHNLITSYHLLKKIIIENDIKLVHAHARIPAFVCGLVRKRLSFRFVTTAHWIFKTVFPLNILTNWGERSLAVSEDIKEYLMKYYHLPEDHIKVTINGIDTEKFSEGVDYAPIAEEFSFSPDAYRVVYISRMDKDRSLAAHKLIESTEALYRENGKLEVVIVGGGNDFKEVAALAEGVNKKLGRRVIIMTDSRVDINRFVASADLFVGVSRSALEAMAAKKPVVIAGNEGYIGIFNEDTLQVGIDTNFCCRGCGDTTSEKLINDIRKIMQMEQDEIQALGTFGRETIRKYYSTERMASDALTLYQWVRYPVNEIDVMISGYYGFDNNGDDAVLKAIVDGLKKEDPDIKIMVLSKQPAKTGVSYGVMAVNRFDFLQIYRYLGKTTLLLSGGGSLIQDLTSTHSLLYYLWVIRFALMQKTKVMLFANGIGPVRRNINKKRIQKVLNQVDLITLRDDHSKAVLQELNVTKPEVRVTIDAAFSLENREEDKFRIHWKERVGLETGTPYICIAVRSWKYFQDGFETEMALFADKVGQTYGLAPVFVPMQPLNDVDISLRIISGMKEKGIFLGTDYTTEELLDLIAGATFVVAMRLHTIIYAVKRTVPVIGVAYDPKVTAFMEKAGQPFCVDIQKVSADRLLEHVAYIMQNRDRVILDMQEKSKDFKLKSHENTQMAIDLLKQKEF